MTNPGDNPPRIATETLTTDLGYSNFDQQMNNMETLYFSELELGISEFRKSGDLEKFKVLKEGIILKVQESMGNVSNLPNIENDVKAGFNLFFLSLQSVINKKFNDTINV